MTNNSPSVDKDTYSSFHYGAPSPALLEMYFEENFHPQVIKPCHPLIKVFLDNIKKVTMLDLGCGIGSRFVQGALYYGMPPENLVSLDYNVENFAEDEYPRLNKLVASADAIPIQDNSFLMVHSSNLSADNPALKYEQVLEEVCRVLKPGGFYIAFEQFDRGEFLKKQDPEKYGHVIEYTPLFENAAFLDKCGFGRFERVEYFLSQDHPFQFMFYLFVKENK